MAHYLPEPFRIKMVEPLRVTTREEREAAIAAAHYNLFALKSDDVYIDMLTDSGTNAMSDRQWAALMLGDESYAGARSYYQLMDSCEEIFGWKFFQPVHQGRAAEKVLFPCLLSPGKVSISNMHFDTTRGHVGLCGARPIDCVVPDARDTENFAPFKGNMDVPRLEKLIAEYGEENVGAVVMTITNNSAGGQPVSLENLRAVSKVCKAHKLTLCIDAARYAENAWFIKQREKGCENMSIREIVREMFAVADCFTMSAKKDGIVNMGGLVGVREDEELFIRIKGNVVPNEGFVTYGGLNGRDLAALAVGLQEGLDENFLSYYIGQVSYLGEKLKEKGVPFQYPTGGHAVFLDARRILPHLSYERFPGHTLALEIYKEGGIRGCDIGTYILDPDPVTGVQPQAEMEFTRYCIPRRVYTQAHLDYIADSIEAVMARASECKGYRIIWQPKVLRHFTAKLEAIED